jgi:acyl transferase domain-containing protein
MKSQLAASGSAPNNTSESVALAPSPIPRSGKNLASQQNKQHLINEDEPEASLSLLPKLSIVGAGCILPGGASSPDRLFAAITEQRLGLVDQRTLDPHWTDDFYSAKLIPDRSTSHLAGRVDDADIVAPQGIDPDDFKRFTRTQQLLCISLAGCLGSLQGAKRIACIVGATADGFEDLDEVTSLVYCGIDPTDSFVDQQIHSARSAGQTPHSAVQEVIDQMLGPGVKVTLIDAACASSLYAIALGMQLLERDVADAVIAGGLFCPGPGNSCLFSQFGGTTSTGCRPFDANADGVVFSEGAALVTLRRQSDAKRLGLPILANVRGAGLSSDGKSSSANVPQTHGQLLALERCYRKYGIDPSSIQAIEAHGTSTPVGDSTELETLRRFFSSHLSEPIPVHSLKGLLGHAGWAAGAASVIAVCEYFHQRIFPAQAFYQEPSQAVRNSDGVLSVPLLPIALASGPLRIAIDGFGFGGANAHMVLESAEGVASQDDYYQHLKVPTGTDDDSIVIVAFHEIAPQESSVGGARFDRGQVKLPKKFLVLPDLAEDMDVSQILTVTLTDEIVQQLCTDDAELRRETGVILALRGKTERGVEATTRVLGQRLLRQLGEDARYKAALESACQRARPSRAYTLQCMMPNVASGRAALMRRTSSSIRDATHFRRPC